MTPTTFSASVAAETANKTTDTVKQPDTALAATTNNMPNTKHAAPAPGTAAQTVVVKDAKSVIGDDKAEATVVDVKEVAPLKVETESQVPVTPEIINSEVEEKAAQQTESKVTTAALVTTPEMSITEEHTKVADANQESAKVEITAEENEITFEPATPDTPAIPPVESEQSDATETVDASDNTHAAEPAHAPHTITTMVTSTLPPMTPQRNRIGMNLGLHAQTPQRSPRSHHTPRTPSTPASPNIELSAKQVRELRRLCRKTANRAEYEGRLVQLRQIASILAMGGPSLIHFAPSYLAAHSAMQAWLDASRTGGADWRDERPLSIAAVDELREWDRLLKAWAKRRFPTLADCVEGCAPPTTPRTKRLDLMSVASPMSVHSPSPARALVAAQSATTPSSPGSVTPGTRRRVSRMSISHDGDTINVSIVRTPEKPEKPEMSEKSPWRPNTPRRDQENVHPDGEVRDWRALRKGGESTTGNTALKARNW